MTRSPMAPEVSDRLAHAVAGLADLKAQTDGIAEATLLNRQDGAAKKLTVHQGRIRDAEGSVAELRLLLKAAERTDARAAADQRREQRLAQLSEFEAVGAIKQRAIATYCRAVEITAKAFLDVLEAGLQMSGWVSDGTNLARHGLDPAVTAEALVLDGSGNVTAFASNVETIAASEMARHARTTRIGNSGAMPRARALSPTVMQNPDAVEPWPNQTSA